MCRWIVHSWIHNPNGHYMFTFSGLIDKQVCNVKWAGIHLCSSFQTINNVGKICHLYVLFAVANCLCVKFLVHDKRYLFTSRPQGEMYIWFLLQQHIFLFRRDCTPWFLKLCRSSIPQVGLPWGYPIIFCENVLHELCSIRRKEQIGEKRSTVGTPIVYWQTRSSNITYMLLFHFDDVSFIELFE